MMEPLAKEANAGFHAHANAVQKIKGVEASKIDAPAIAASLVPGGGAKNAAPVPTGGKKTRKKKTDDTVLDAEIAVAKKREEEKTIPKGIGDQVEASVTAKAERTEKQHREANEGTELLSARRKTEAEAAAATPTEFTGTMRHVCPSVSCRVLLPRSSLGETLECCPACGYKFSSVFVRCQKEATRMLPHTALSSSITTALNQHGLGLHILLPKNAETLLPFYSNPDRIANQFVYDDGSASGYLLRHIIQSEHLTKTLMGHVLTAKRHEKQLYTAKWNAEEEAKRKIAEAFIGLPSSVGCWVRAKESFFSDNEDQTEVPKDSHGKVEEIDEDGDASIDFEGIGPMWVLKCQFFKISVLSRRNPPTLTVKVATCKHLEHFEAADLHDWQNVPMLQVNPTMTFDELKKTIRETAHVEAENLRIWPCCTRKNETIRTQSFTHTSGDIALKDLKHFGIPQNDIAIKIFVEQLKPGDKPTNTIHDKDSLIFFKFWDPKQKSLRHIGHYIFTPTTRVKAMVELALSQFLPHLQLEDIDAFEELKPDKIENLLYTVQDDCGNEREALLQDKQVELQSGDIVVIQPAGLEGTDQCVRLHYNYLHCMVLALEGALKPEKVQQVQGFATESLKVSKGIVALKEQGDIEGILDAMRVNIQHVGVQSAACEALGTLALLGDDADERSSTIGTLGGIECILSAMDIYSTDCEIQRYGLEALFNLIFDVDNAEKMRASLWVSVQRIVCAMALDETDQEIQTHGGELLLRLEDDSESDDEEEEEEEAKQAADDMWNEAVATQRATGDVVVQILRGSSLQVTVDVPAKQLTFDNFATVGAPEALTTSGVLYYEIEVLEAGGEPQIGFALDMDVCESTDQGCGDSRTSWALDGTRKVKWFDGDSPWDCEWSVGDVVGLAANVDFGKIAVSKNGKWSDEACGVVFEDEKIKSGVFPCLTAAEFKLRYAFKEHTYDPPQAAIWALPPIEAEAARLETARKMKLKVVLEALSVKAEVAGECEVKKELLKAISRAGKTHSEFCFSFSDNFESVMIFLEWMSLEGVALILKEQLQADSPSKPHAISLVKSALHWLYELVSREERFGQYRKVSAVKISGVKAGKDDLVNGTYFPVGGERCGGKVVYKREDTKSWIEYSAATQKWQVKPKASRGTSSSWMESVGVCAGTDTVDDVTGGWNAYNATNKVWAIQHGASISRAKVGKDDYRKMIDTMLETFVCAIPEWVSCTKVDEYTEILRQLMASAKSNERLPSQLNFSPKLSANFSRRHDAMEKEWNILAMAIISNIPKLMEFVLISMPSLSLDNVVVRGNTPYPPLHFACTQRVAVEKTTFTDCLNWDFKPSSPDVIKVCVLAGLAFKVKLGIHTCLAFEEGYPEGHNEPVLHIELTNSGALDDNMTITVEINLVNMTKKRKIFFATQATFSVAKYCNGPFVLSDIADELKLNNMLQVSLKLQDDVDIMQSSTALQRQCTIMGILLDKGASVKATKICARTPLMVAIEHDQAPEVIQLLLSRMDPLDVCALINREIEQMTTKSQDLASIRRLAPNVSSVFNRVFKGNKIDCNLRMLMKKQGMQACRIICELIPYTRDSHVKEVLSLCAKDKEYSALLPKIFEKISSTIDLTDLPIMTVVENGNLKILTLLLEKRASPNSEIDRGPCPKGQKGGLTPLHAALLQGTDFVKVLMEAKADCIQGGRDDCSPLHEACKIDDEEKSKAMVRLILEGGTLDLTVRNKNKKIPTEITRHQSVRDLLSHHQKHASFVNKATVATPTKVAPTKSQMSSLTKAQKAHILDVDEHTRPNMSRSNSSAVALPETLIRANVSKLACPETDLDQRLKEMLVLLEETAAAASVPSTPTSQIDSSPTAVYSTSVGAARKLPRYDFPGAVAADALTTSTGSHSSPSSTSAGVDAENAANDNTGWKLAAEVGAGWQSEGVVGGRGREDGYNGNGKVDDVDVGAHCIAADVGEPGLVANVRQMLLSGDSWELRFTREFKNQMFSMHTTPVLRDSLVKNIFRLASGEQSKGLLKHLQGTPRMLAIFESPVKTFNDGDRFLWTRSAAYSQRVQGFTDFITLWKICKHDEVPKGMQFIIESHSCGRKSTMKKCLKPKIHGSMLADGKRFPRHYELRDRVDMQQLEEQDKLKFQELTPEDWQQVLGVETEETAEDILFTPPAVTNADSQNVLKFYQLNDEVLQSLFAFRLPSEQLQLEQDAAIVPEFPFIPDDREDRLINLDAHVSTLLCGRSGTGKTSIAVSRMWALYKHCHSPSWQGGARNQIFVTTNRVLRNEVRKSFGGMKHGFRGMHVPVVTEYPASFRDIPEEMFPLFLTQAEYLKMIDGTLKEPFWPRNSDGSLKHQDFSAFHEEEGMLDVLPDQGEYQEADWSDSSDDGHDGEELLQGGGGGHGHGSTKSKETRIEIDFTVFSDKIFPRISASLVKNEVKYVSAASLWTEIHSYIKGGVEALRSQSGRLTRVQYNALGVKMAPVFKQTLLDDMPADRAGTRDLVYTLYEEYEKERARLDGYDVADVVFHIYRQLEEYPDQARTAVHSMFVDETQDFTQAELALFVRVVEDKNDTFFSGDTCQTIALGVNFRFEDLKSIFQYEKMRQQQENAGASLPAKHVVKIPQVHYLDINYRTHNGILAAAAGIVDLLEHFFGNTIDSMPREKGFFEGNRPILLSETAEDDAAVMILGSDRKHSQIEFGAHQVLLMRTQASKDKLPSFFDGILATTILEAKGLEFDDVFLWNFVTDSTASQEWRILLTFLVERDDHGIEKELIASMHAAENSKDVKGMLRILQFSEQEHHIMCSELKQLYTAITRARVRVVIYDENPATRAPLFYFFERLGLCDKIKILEDGPTPGFVKETSADEWRARGKNLMENKVYPLAAQCFGKSGDSDLEHKAVAWKLLTYDIPSLRQEGKHKEVPERFIEAAERLLKCGRNELTVADCCYKAALEFQKLGGSKMVKNAKTCFELAGTAYLSSLRSDALGDQRILKRAVACLTKRAEKFDKCVNLLVSRGRTRHALKLLHEQKKYDAALDLVQAHAELHFAPPHDLCHSNLLQLCANGHAVAANNAKRSESSRKQSLDKFKELIKQMSDDQVESQLLMHGYKEQLSERLVERGDFAKAARLLDADEKREEAARILCDTNPSPAFSDFAFGIELLLAHALCTDASEEQRLNSFTKAQELQSRMHDLSDCCSDFQKQTQLSLDFFITKIADAHDKEERLNSVNATLDSLSGVSNENELARTLCSIELCALKRMPGVQETHALVNNIDGILHSVDSKDHNTLTLHYLRCEQFFDIRRTDGVATISRSRKAIMDWTLEMHESSPDDNKTVFNAEEDIIINPLKFRTSLTEHLLNMRHRMLVKVLAHLSHTSLQKDIAAGERLKNLLLIIWGMSVSNKKKVCADKSELQPVNVGDWVKLSGLTGKNKKYNDEEALVQKNDLLSVHAFTVSRIHAGGRGNDLSGLKAENLRYVDPLSKKSLSDTCERLDICLSGECLRQEQHLRRALPSFFSKHDVELVWQELRKWIWDSFGRWNRLPMSLRSERTLSVMLLIFERMGHTIDAAQLLSAVDRNCKQRAGEVHTFSDLVKAQRFGQNGYLQMQALSIMRHLHAHPPIMVVSDDVLQSRDTMSLRLVLRALVLSLVDLRRLHIQNCAEMIKWKTLTTAILLPSSFARSIVSLKFVDNKTLTGVETLILALQNLAGILTVYENSSNGPQARALLSSNTVDEILSVVALIGIIKATYQLCRGPFPKVCRGMATPLHTMVTADIGKLGDSKHIDPSNLRIPA